MFTSPSNPILFGLERAEARQFITHDHHKTLRPQNFLEIGTLGPARPLSEGIE
jgi:hypothetical protein